MDNRRPVQPLLGRKIFVSTDNFSMSDILTQRERIFAAAADEDEDEPQEVDHFFLLMMSIIIFFMQCGFAFMEAGAVR